jgi:hypothetical protein
MTGLKMVLLSVFHKTGKSLEFEFTLTSNFLNTIKKNLY